MRPVDVWFTEYGQSHTHPTNELIHWICVPLILWTVIALLWIVPVPSMLGKPGLWAGLASVAAMGFYIRLSWRLAAGMALLLLACLLLSALLYSMLGNMLGWLAVAVFVLAWIGQFIGHHIEGKKPSFFRDLFFLLVGPAWLMGHLYRRLGIAY